MTDKIEPCPVCGGDSVLTELHDHGYSVYGRFWYTAICKECGFSIADREEFDENSMLIYPAKECLEKWNTLAQSARRAEQAEAALRGLVSAGKDVIATAKPPLDDYAYDALWDFEAELSVAKEVLGHE